MRPPRRGCPGAAIPERRRTRRCVVAACGRLRCGRPHRIAGSRRYNDGLAPRPMGPHPSHMYSRSSEPVRFERDCEAVLVPQGESVTLPAGSVGDCTPALGGCWSVFVQGSLFRIAGKGGAAIGREPPEPLSLPDDADDAAVAHLVCKQLRTSLAPEIPINVVDLGLIYEAV